MALLVERHAGVLEAEPDARLAVAGFLRSLAAMLADPSLPGGCFIINRTSDCGGSTIPASVEMALREAMQASEAMIFKRLQRAQRDGALAADAQPEALAVMFGAIIAGMAVQAKSGAHMVKLNAVVDAAIALWLASAPA